MRLSASRAVCSQAGLTAQVRLIEDQETGLPNSKNPPDPKTPCRYLLIEDQETGDVVMPLILLKPILGLLDLVSRSGTLRRAWRKLRSQ